MGRNKGGGGRSYNAPVIYEPATTAQGMSISRQGMMVDVENSAINFPAYMTNGADAETVSSGDGMPQLIECEDNHQIELWLAALQEFLTQFEQQGATFYQTHHISREVMEQLTRTIIGLLTTERAQLRRSQISAIYQSVQQILLKIRL